MKGMIKKCYGLLLALSIIFGLSLSVSLDANAATTHYTSATVNFYAGQQVNATVNLPWSVNPSTHRFFLNDVWFNDYDYQNTKLAYISGRIVLEVNPKTTTDFYVCGRDTSNNWGTGATGYCLGSFTVKYTDNSSSIQNDIPVYFNEISSPYTYNIYYDFNLQLDANKTVNFIQFHYYGTTGYDVISRNTNWNNTTLMVMVEGRSSISAFETPPSGTDIANDLLQTQVGQNNTIIDQNQQTYDYLTDNTPPTADTSVLSGSSGWLPVGPVDSILTLPVQLAQGIVNVFTNPGQCSALSLPLPWIDYNLEIPCVGPLMDTVGFTPIWGIIGGIISAFIIYDTLKWLYKFVDDTLTLRENNSTMWGGL